MKNVITLPVVKAVPVEPQTLKTEDLEYIQQAILDREALGVHTEDCPGADIPEEFQDQMSMALLMYSMVVDRLLKWAKVTDPESYEKYLHKTTAEIREMPTVTAQRGN